MKRIIALFAAIAMVFAFASIGFAANDFSITAKTLDAEGNGTEVSVKDLAVGDTFVLAIYIDKIPADFTVFAQPIVFDQTKIAPVEVDGSMISTDQKISKKNYWGVGFDVTKFGGSASYAGSASNSGAFEFDPAEPLFYVYMKKLADSGTVTVTTDGTQFADANEGFFTPTAELSFDIELGGSEPQPTVKTITKTGADVLINNAKDKSETETTAEQIGGAAGFAFTIPAGVTLDDNMIWSLTTSEGKKFSQKVNAGLSALSGDVKVAATFVTGSHLAGEGRTPFNFEIKAADGIFKAGEDFYFTDAADAALKAE
mgnify:FL=1